LIERYNVDAKRLQVLFKKRGFENPPEAVKTSLGSREGAAIIGAIAAGLGKSSDPVRASTAAKPRKPAGKKSR